MILFSMLKKNNLNIKAIIFDLDDTLYLEKDFVISGFRVVSDYLAKEYSLKKEDIFTALKNDFDLGVRGNSFNKLLDALNLPKKELKKIISVYRDHNPKIKLCVDSKKFLDSKKNNEIKLGLISDGNVKMQKNKIIALGIDKIFDVVVLSDSLGKDYRKPNQKVFEIILKK